MAVSRPAFPREATTTVPGRRPDPDHQPETWITRRGVVTRVTQNAQRRTTARRSVLERSERRIGVSATRRSVGGVCSATRVRRPAVSDTPSTRWWPGLPGSPTASLVVRRWQLRPRCDPDAAASDPPFGPAAGSAARAASVKGVAWLPVSALKSGTADWAADAAPTRRSGATVEPEIGAPDRPGPCSPRTMQSPSR